MAHQRAFSAERFAGTHNLPLRNTALGVFGAAVAIGHGLTLLEKSQHSKDPHFVINHHPGEQAIFILTGCRQNGEQIARMLDPELGKHGTTVCAIYPENGFSVRAIGKGMIRARQEAGKKPVSVYAISMGGLALAELGADEGFLQEFGHIETVIFDSSPSSITDILPNMRRMLMAARLTRNSYIMSRLAPAIMTHMSHREHDHEPSIDDAQVTGHFESTAHTPLHVIASQGDYLYKQRGLVANSISNLADRFIYVQSSNDRVVDTDAAFEGFSLATGNKLQRVVDEQRPPTSHAAGPEFPSFIANLLAKQRQQLLVA